MDPRPAGSSGPAGAPNVVPANPTQALAGIDEELARLAELTVAEHVPVFTEIHQRLTTALAATGGAAPAAGPSRPAGTGPRPTDRQHRGS